MAKRTHAGTRTPKPKASEQIRRELAARALEKRRRGEDVPARELAALTRIEKEREEEERWAYYKTIPQRHWKKMSGARQTKVINEQAVRYGIPFGGDTIDLSAVVKALHDFLRDNARKLAAADDEDALLAGMSSPALELYRRERAKLAKLDRLEREQSLLSRELVHEGLGRIASILRLAGETLARQCGPEAHEILEDALKDADREIQNLASPRGDPAADTHDRDQ